MTKKELQSFRKYIYDKSEIINFPNYMIAIYKTAHPNPIGREPTIIADVGIIDKNDKDFKPFYKTFENFCCWLEENNLMNEFETKLEEIILKKL